MQALLVGMSYHEVLLTGRFRKALKTLNPWLTDKQLQECVERMTEHMSSQLGMKIIELERIIEYKHIFLTHNYHFFT